MTTILIFRKPGPVGTTRKRYSSSTLSAVSSYVSISDMVPPIEDRTISAVPDDERYGDFRDLFSFWFGPNVTLLAVVNGALATAVYGLPFWLAALGLVIGNLIGGAVLALHSVQGAQLGVPQLVQTRAQFGSSGAIGVAACVAVISVGFLAVNLVLAGQSLNTLSSHITVAGTIIAVAAVSTLLAVFGYDVMHSAAWLLSWIGGVVLLLAFVWVIGAGHLAVGFWHSGQVSALGFAGAVSVAVLWQISYTPYAADFSRYLPAGTPARQTFLASFLGTSAGSIAAMLLGAIVGVQSSDVLGGFITLAHGSSIMVVGTFTACLALAGSINVYGGTMSVLSIGQALAPRWQPRLGSRAVLALIIGALAALGAVFGQSGFLVGFTSIVVLVMYVLVPWTAINLVDYFLVRAGQYEVADLARADGGGYGRVRWAAVGCFLAGIAVEAPFVRTPAFTGPAATALGGADIAWLVGGALVAPLYYFVARPRKIVTAAEPKITAAIAS
jgi:nucleobase:cation symporter-1, NCS1 family